MAGNCAQVMSQDRKLFRLVGRSTSDHQTLKSFNDHHLSADIETDFYSVI